MAFLAGVTYVYMKPYIAFNAPVAAPTPPRELSIGGGRPLHNWTVVRCDADGFVVSAQEGTFKLFNRNLSPEMYNQLKASAPEVAPTPMAATRSLMESHSLMGGTPTPSKKR